MSKEITSDQKKVHSLLSEYKFLIPDYQRPYTWEEDRCEQLWNDLYGFAFPTLTEFNEEDSEYFMGSIVTFENKGKMEVIDGQQRLTTILLLLRAFYNLHQEAKDARSVDLCKGIRDCIWKTAWKTDDDGNSIEDIEKRTLKIETQVAMADDREEFDEILKIGVAPDSMKSRYAENFRFFEKKIDTDLKAKTGEKFDFPSRILENVIFLSVKAGSNETALRIFSTLNDRGLPLSDSDIFKSRFYKFFAPNEEKKKNFIERWNKLTDKTKIFKNRTSNRNTSPTDELFMRYMYFLRAKNKMKELPSLRDFYSKNEYAEFQKEETLGNLEYLLNCWKDVGDQQEERFSEKALRHLFVLNYAPSNLWNFIVSVWFMSHKNDANFKSAEFEDFLDRLSAFVIAYVICKPATNSLRTPFFPEMENIVDGGKPTFEGNRISRAELESNLKAQNFGNNRRITRSMLTWWLLHNPEQTLFPLEKSLQIEHIFPTSRKAELKDQALLECLGNKTLLESNINISVSNWRYADKLKKYKDKKTQIHELQELIAKADKEKEPPTDFPESEIKERNNKIFNSFINHLEKLGLLKD